jgi:hypothetical protein
MGWRGTGQSNPLSSEAESECRNVRNSTLAAAEKMPGEYRPR